MNSKERMMTDAELYIQAHNQLVCENRRDLLKKTTGVLAGVAALGIFGSRPALASRAVTEERILNIFAPALGETSKVVYWIPGEGYIRESLDEISWALRDRRTNTAKLYDPHVIDQLYAVSLQLGYSKPVHALSGYRSPKTNNMLRRTMRGVAKNSFHLQGKAIDIRIPGISTAQLRNAALSLKAGGVGYYSQSRFVHIDSGVARNWGK